MGLCSRQRIATLPLALVAHVIGEAEAQERQRDPAFVLLTHQQQPVAAALDVMDVALAGPAGAGLLGDPWRGWRSGFPGVDAAAPLCLRCALAVRCQGGDDLRGHGLARRFDLS